MIYNGNDRLAAVDGTRVKALTYAMIIRPPGNCWGINFIRHQDVLSKNKGAEYKINFDFLFDGKTSTQSPTKLLEAYGF
jgi:hypothetical protein